MYQNQIPYFPNIQNSLLKNDQQLIRHNILQGGDDTQKQGFDERILAQASPSLDLKKVLTVCSLLKHICKNEKVFFHSSISE